MDKQTIGVIGAGTMGSGITQLAAQSGMNVILWDISEEDVNKGMGRIDATLSKLVKREKITDKQKTNIVANIRTTTNLEQFKGATVVVEAVVENMEVKKDVFRQLDEVLPEETIIATNTSSLSITSLAEVTGRQDRVAGMHFFNPAPVMKLVEVIRGYKTSDKTVSTLMELARQMGKEPIEVKKDTPGFIVNRVMIPQFIEAIRLVEEGVATVEDVDKAVKLGLNYPMGPFELQDFAGVDIGLHVMEYFYEEYMSERYAPPMAIKRLIRAGRLGRKAGAGWYDYDKS